MLVVSIEKSGPLLRTDTKTSVHSHLDDLTVMLATKGLVRTKLHTETRKQGHMCVSLSTHCIIIKYRTETIGHSVLCMLTKDSMCNNIM